MKPTLAIPDFPRLHEYFGCWSMEPVAFRGLADTISRLDFAAHLRVRAEEQPQPAAAIRMEEAKNGRKVAVIPVLGTLMKQRSSMGGTSTIELRRDIRNAAADPGTAGILLAVDSPGGTVAGIDDLVAEIREARKSKPVWSHVDDLCASAAYWVASQTERVVANSPTALVGSIGTILTVYDASEMFAKDGVKAMVFSTGPLKGAGMFGTKITDEQAAYFQNIVSGLQENFDAAVSKGRGFSKDELKQVRTGGVWKADAAQGLRLIDGIQSLQKTIDQLAAASAGQERAKGPRGEEGFSGLAMRTLCGLPNVAPETKQ